MPFVDTNELKIVERLPGWKGRYFHSANMIFAHYEFAAGSSIQRAADCCRPPISPGLRVRWTEIIVPATAAAVVLFLDGVQETRPLRSLLSRGEVAEGSN